MVSLVIGAIILLYAVLNFSHVVDGFFHIPGNTIYLGISHWYEDYLYYVSQVTQGMTGKNLVVNLYSPDAIPASINWYFNLLLGKILWFTHVSPWRIYDIALFCFVCVFLILVYKLNKTLFKNPTLVLIATIIAISNNPFYSITTDPTGNITITPFDFFFSPGPSLNRLGGIFTHALQNSLMVGVLLLWHTFTTRILAHTHVTKKTMGIGIALSLLFVSLFINNAYSAMILMGSLGLATAILALKTKNKSTIIRAFLTLFGVYLPVLIPFFMQMQTFSHPFFRYTIDWEKNMGHTDPKSFLMAMGLMSIFAPIGLIPFAKKHSSPLRMGILSYCLVSVGLYFSPIPPLIGAMYTRIPTPLLWVCFASFAAVGLWTLSSLIVKILPTKLRPFILPILVSLYIGFQIPPLYREVTTRITDARSWWYVNYADKHLLTGLTMVKNNPSLSLGIAPLPTALLVPVMTGKTVFVAHRTLSTQVPERVTLIDNFYRLNMPADAGKQFLSENHIDFVVFQGADQPTRIMMEAYPFLTPFYTSPTATIFTVK